MRAPVPRVLAAGALCYERAPRTSGVRGLAFSSWLERGRGAITVGGAP